jgi:hypothetical protein
MPRHVELEAPLLAALDGEWRELSSLAVAENTRHLIGPAQRLALRGLIESRLNRHASAREYRLRS